MEIYLALFALFYISTKLPLIVCELVKMFNYPTRSTGPGSPTEKERQHIVQTIQ